jgi:hypothetical protein
MLEIIPFTDSLLNYAIGPLVIPLITAGSALATQFIQNRMNKKMSDYTYQKDQAMWDKTNQYNTPANQMQRFGAAGLNPNLIYDKVSNSLPAASMPKYTPPERTFKVPDTMQILNQFQDFALKSKQIDSVTAQIARTEADTSLKNLLRNLKDPTNSYEFAKYDENGNVIPGSEYKYTPGETALKIQQSQAQAAELKNAKTVQETNAILMRMGLTESQANWARLKYDRMSNSDVNIDKDNLWAKIIADIAEDPIRVAKKFFKGNVKNALKSVKK